MLQNGQPSVGMREMRGGGIYRDNLGVWPKMLEIARYSLALERFQKVQRLAVGCVSWTRVPCSFNYLARGAGAETD